MNRPPCSDNESIRQPGAATWTLTMVKSSTAPRVSCELRSVACWRQLLVLHVSLENLGVRKLKGRIK